MAVPTKPECKLNLSFDMAAKTMTVFVSENIAVAGMSGLTYYPYYATLVDPLGNIVDIDEINFNGTDGVAFQTYDAP